MTYTSREFDEMPRDIGVNGTQPFLYGKTVPMDEELEDPISYNIAREKLKRAEKERAFDASTTVNSSDIEIQAARLVRKIVEYDQENTFGEKNNMYDQLSGKNHGEHFLGNVDLINKTELMKVAKKMPKGAHLHIHFNSCLPARFLLRQARNIDAMYIRSTLALTNSENMDRARISFMVMTLYEATHTTDPDGHEQYVPLGNVWDENYIPNRWMPYRKFHTEFDPHDTWNERQYGLERTVAAELWLEKKMQFTEDEAHHSKQTGHGVWACFNQRTQMMKGLFAYESAFRLYTEACIRDFVEDNIQFAEIRPNFMSTNSLKTDDGTGSIGNEGILAIIEDQLKKTTDQLKSEGKYFGGMKVIYCTPRIFRREQIASALYECIELKRKYKNLICGFDLVGHEEMGNELRLFVPEFIEFRKRCKTLGLEIPFLFHCGETLQNGGNVDSNLYDAILLKAKRIGHGYAVARHPLLMEMIKERNIAIEVCPISNEVLGLTPAIHGHHLPILLANNVPCTINSDNATFYRSSLSHDFYQVMIGSESMTLHGWKQLAMWSLEHSCMTTEELKQVTAEWSRRWDEFCRWIIDEYGPKLHNWEPKTGHC
ncbi:hypothetical protein K3495_g8341 [Podosphaera aphanis]|nr:hypothetical protein K3495_g8341 [Podosphaera aphanis]